MNTIDIHTHGIGGCDTRTTTSADILKLAETHGRLGVSEILPTIYPASIDEMRANMAAVREAMERQRSEVRGRRSDKSKLKAQGLKPVNTHAARILGVHLEGPFLNPSKYGALDPASFLKPTIRSLKRLIEGFEDSIKIITLAPELEGATKLIKTISGTGIIVSMGHSDATYAEAEAGFHAGARGITHILNAMRGLHHREPGIAGFGLINKDVYIEVIADQYNLNPEIIRLIFNAKPVDKIIIVSDSVKSTSPVLRSPSSISRLPSSIPHLPSLISHLPSSISPPLSPITDYHGVLTGGSMAVIEAAKRLIEMGMQKEIVMPCISDNPASYLNRGRNLYSSGLF